MHAIANFPHARLLKPLLMKLGKLVAISVVCLADFEHLRLINYCHPPSMTKAFWSEMSHPEARRLGPSEDKITQWQKQILTADVLRTGALFDIPARAGGSCHLPTTVTLRPIKRVWSTQPSVIRCPPLVEWPKYSGT